MNPLRAYKTLRHFRVLNGRHWVLLCNPSVLANERNSVTHRSQTLCPGCHAALAEDDTQLINREVFKRMNDIGKPQK